MKRLRRYLGIWDTLKVAAGMLALAYLCAAGELDAPGRTVAAVLWGGALALVVWTLAAAALRCRQRLTCGPGVLCIRSWRGREREIAAREVGELAFTDSALCLLGRDGRRLGRVFWTNRLRRTAGLDALEALLTPGGGLRWDREGVTVRRSRRRRVWTAASAALLLALWVAVAVFLWATGQLDRESEEAWLCLMALLAIWSLWRLLAVFRRRIWADGEGLRLVPAVGAARKLPWGTFSLEWTETGIPKLPGEPLLGYETGLLALCLALRDHGLFGEDPWAPETV